MWFYLYLVNFVSLMAAYTSALVLATAIASTGSYREATSSVVAATCYLVIALIVWGLHFRWLRGLAAGRGGEQVGYRGLIAFVAAFMAASAMVSAPALLHDALKPLFERGEHVWEAVGNGVVLAVSLFFWSEYGKELRRVATKQIETMQAGLKQLA